MVQLASDKESVFFLPPPASLVPGSCSVLGNPEVGPGQQALVGLCAPQAVEAGKGRPGVRLTLQKPHWAAEQEAAAPWALSSRAV